jgi:hypothetical protein
MSVVFQPSTKDVVSIESQAPAAEQSPTLLRLAMLCCLYAIPVLATVHGDADYDMWWHLRVGQWVAGHGTVPITDPFSSYGHDKAWVAYSWLFELLLYGAHQCFGLLGIVFFRLVLCVAVTVALHRFIAKREPRFLVATALTGAATLGVAMLFKERPWLFTILLSVLTLDVILDLREGKRGLMAWFLPLLFVVWANVHIQFVYGLILLFLACACPLLEDWLRRTKPGSTAATARSAAWWQLIAISAASLLATLVNPYHVGLYRVVFEYATQPGPFRWLNELKSLEFREPSDWVMLVLAGIGCFALGRRRPVSLFDVALLAFSGWLAFRSRRDMWLLILTSLYLITTLPRKPVESSATFRFSLPRFACVVVVGVLLIVATVLLRNLSNETMKTQVAKTFPVKAAEHVAEKGYPGPLYNDFNWGGYLIWALPDLLVAIDGRTNLHGDERIEHLGDVWAAIPTAADDAELFDAGVIIAPATSPRVSLLQRDPRFKARFDEVYSDDLARVFVRK